MAFADLLNQGINNLTGTPLGQLGTQLLMASGPQQGNPGFGARMGQALGGMSEMQRVQALQQYRDQMMQMQQQQMQMAQAQQESKQRQQQEYQKRLHDPAFLAGLSPTARMMAQLGADPADLARGISTDALQAHRQATLQQNQSQFDQRIAHQGGGGQSSGPRMPTQRQVLDQPLGDGMMQRHVLNPSTGQYEAYGKPFPQYSPGRKGKAATGADAMTDAILNSAPSDDEPVPDASTLPGTGNLQSYAPQPQQPIGVLPMAAQGGNAVQKPAPKAGTRVPGQAQIARPLSKADYDALPAGSQYIDPVSGKTATKRG